MQRGLAETSGPAAPFGPCHSIGHLSCQYLSLDQENLHLPLQIPAQSKPSGNIKGIRRQERAFLGGGRADAKAWQLAW